MFNICGSFCRLVDLVGLGDFARGGASSKAEKHSAQAGATIQRHFNLLSSKMRAGTYGGAEACVACISWRVSL